MNSKLYHIEVATETAEQIKRDSDLARYLKWRRYNESAMKRERWVSKLRRWIATSNVSFKFSGEACDCGREFTFEDAKGKKSKIIEHESISTPEGKICPIVFFLWLGRVHLEDGTMAQFLEEKRLQDYVRIPKRRGPRG